MSLPFTLHPLAELDVLGAWEWYEQQRPGLGDRFVAAVGAAIGTGFSLARSRNAGDPRR